MPSAEAITPLPVYGILSSSSAPCTVPSSPKRPCSAMNARSKPSSTSACRFCTAGSNGWASTPLRSNDASTAAPLFSETSRSAERPPNNTATLPSREGGREKGEGLPLSMITCVLTNNPHFTLQLYTGLLPHGGLHLVNQILYICRSRITGIHDEVGVLFRHPGTADPPALQAALLDQPGGMVAGRIAEHRTGIRQIQRLAGDAPGQQRLDRLSRRLTVAVVKSQPGGDKNLRGLRTGD